MLTPVVAVDSCRHTVSRRFPTQPQQQQQQRQQHRDELTTLETEERDLHVYSAARPSQRDAISTKKKRKTLKKHKSDCLQLSTTSYIIAEGQAVS